VVLGVGFVEGSGGEPPVALIGWLMAAFGGVAVTAGTIAWGVTLGLQSEEDRKIDERRALALVNLDYIYEDEDDEDDEDDDSPG
jgi:hypothetical protein